MPTPQKNSTTIRDVARRAGVSVATVSRVVNRTAPVSSEVTDRVRAVMAELKFVPRAAARNLATRKTNTLGLLLTDILGDFFVPLLSGIESVTHEAGYDLLISTSNQVRFQADFPIPLGPHNTDGLLIFTEGISENALTQCYESGLPVVLIHQSSPAYMGIPCVTVENKAASRKLVEHLIEIHQRRRIVFLHGPHQQEDSHWRELGYRQALESHGIPYDADLVAAGDFDRAIAQAAISRLIEAGTPFDAVFSGDDEAAVGVYEALKKAGLNIPEDVSVIGFDDQRFSIYLNPPLTTVCAPTEEVGRVAARQLLNLIRTGSADPITLLPTEIVLRRSCGCPYP